MRKFSWSIFINALLFKRGTPNRPLHMETGICDLSKYKNAVNQHIVLTFLQSAEFKEFVSITNFAFPSLIHLHDKVPYINNVTYYSFDAKFFSIRFFAISAFGKIDKLLNWILECCPLSIRLHIPVRKLS